MSLCSGTEMSMMRRANAFLPGVRSVVAGGIVHPRGRLVTCAPHQTGVHARSMQYCVFYGFEYYAETGAALRACRPYFG